jgi:hypothetical protein
VHNIVNTGNNLHRPSSGNSRRQIKNKVKKDYFGNVKVS